MASGHYRNFVVNRMQLFQPNCMGLISAFSSVYVATTLQDESGITNEIMHTHSSCSDTPHYYNPIHIKSWYMQSTTAIM